MKNIKKIYITILCCLLFLSCQNVLLPELQIDSEKELVDIPEGKGALFISVNEEINSRAVMPGLGSFNSFKLEFVDNAAETVMETIERNNANLNDAVFLSAGTYRLKISAYTSLSGSTPAAEGESAVFTINAGSTTVSSVALTANHASGAGIFSWRITIPAGAALTQSLIEITKLNDDPVWSSDLTFTAGVSQGSHADLPSGYYKLKITLIKDNLSEPVILNPVLHIYNNLESLFSITLGVNDFTAADPKVWVTGGLYNNRPFNTLSAALDSIPAAADGFYTVKIKSHTSPPVASFGGAGSVVTLEPLGASAVVELTGSSYLVTVGSNVTLTLNSGVTLKGSNSNNHPVIYLSNGILNMNNGSAITGNTSSSSNGGAVYVYGGTFNMHGGSISGNSATGIWGGGGVGIYSGTFNMSGGSITGNSASDFGGGVCVTNGTFNMTGGTISGNTTDTGGGGVYFFNGAVNLGGASVINNNFSGINPNNLSLANGRYITLGTGASVPATGMEVHVQTATPGGVIVNSGAAAGQEVYFEADTAGKTVVFKTDTQQLVIE